VIVTADELAAIHAQAVREYPHESCGLILTRGGERRVIPCRNIQEELHAQDPARHPRDARRYYMIRKTAAHR
jgi:proteasome lid subunit RPN8/RPN11